jgi:DNA-binding MarR family transcriptional regulator
MDARSAPGRLRSQPSWLIAQNSQTAQQLVTGRLAALAQRRYHYSMLAALDEFGPMSQAELGRRCGLDRSDVAAAVAELEQSALIERAKDQNDRRRNVVRITEAGGSQLRQLDAALADAQEELLAPLSPAERALLIQLLTRLADHHAPPA